MTTQPPPPLQVTIKPPECDDPGMPLVIQALADIVRDHIDREPSMLQSPDQRKQAA